MEDEAPQFDRAKHDFAVGEKVYAIDHNGYDIYKAEIVNMVGDKIAIHYPDYPNDDEELTGTDRLLVMSDANRVIFEAQEKVRVRAERRASRPKKPKVVRKTKPKGSRSNPKRAAVRGRKNYTE